MASIYERIKRQGRAASDRYAGGDDYFTLSAAGLTLLRSLEPLVAEHCRGVLLDAGAGRGAYRGLLEPHVDDYVGLDVTPRSAVSVAGDVQRLPFRDEVFDTVFCSQVLEHVPRPWDALAEMARVLVPSGRLLITVPHLSWLHNEPHDYYRYTRHGLRYLLDGAGFEVLEIAPAGGLLSLLGHIVSTVSMNTTFGVPLVHGAVRAANRRFVRANAFVDARVERGKLFALNYACVARKPPAIG